MIEELNGAFSCLPQRCRHSYIFISPVKNIKNIYSEIFKNGVTESSINEAINSAKEIVYERLMYKYNHINYWHKYLDTGILFYQNDRSNNTKY